VAVELEDVIIAGLFVQVLAEPGEGWRPQDVDACREVVPGDQFHQRPGDRAIVHVVLERPGGDG